MVNFKADLTFGETGEQFWLDRWTNLGRKVEDCRHLHTYYDFKVEGMQVEIKTYRKERNPIIELEGKKGGPGWFNNHKDDPEVLYIFGWFDENQDCMHCYEYTYNEIKELLPKSKVFHFEGLCAELKPDKEHYHKFNRTGCD